MTNLLAKAGSGVGFSFGVTFWTEMEIWCVNSMYRLKLISSEKNSGFNSLTTIGYLLDVLIKQAMDTVHGPYFHFWLKLALETWVKALLIHLLWVHDLGHTHSLASIQQSGPSDQRALLWTKGCLNCQKWSPYKVKGAFSTPICARKPTNGPPVIDQRFSTGSCNRHHAL